MKTLLRLLLLGAVLLEVGCGLPDTYYLAPPSVTTLATGTSPQFQFSNPIHDLNHDINVTFTGNEMYYKFYANISDIDSNAYDSTNASDAASQLTAKGFFPVCLSTDQVSSRTVPVVPIDFSTAASSSTVTVTVRPQYESTYQLNTNTAVNIRRDVAQSANPTQCKTFERNYFVSNNYAAGGADADVSAALYSAMQLSGNTHIAMYAMSYGVIGSSTPSRSIPVYLGYISFTFTAQ
jgi:hypothetical protein